MKVKHHQLMECGRANVKHGCMHVFLVQAQRRGVQWIPSGKNSTPSDLFMKNLDEPVACTQRSDF